MIRQLEIWDKALFEALNGAHNGFLDFLMPWFSDKWIWIPLYALLLYWLIRSKKLNLFITLGALVVLITLSDQIASGILKPWVERLRPCYDPDLADQVHLLGGCGGQYGFASSHAANAFAAAIFCWLMLKDEMKRIWFLIVWAAIVAYSRVYLGVHFPGDIIAGALIGLGCAQLVYFLSLKIQQRVFNNSHG